MRYNLGYTVLHCVYIYYTVYPLGPCLHCIRYGLMVFQSQAPYDTENPDERFLLKLEVLNDDNFFESLIYKSKRPLLNQCINMNHRL